MPSPSPPPGSLKRSSLFSAPRLRVHHRPRQANVISPLVPGSLVRGQRSSWDYDGGVQATLFCLIVSVPYSQAQRPQEKKGSSLAKARSHHRCCPACGPYGLGLPTCTRLCMPLAGYRMPHVPGPPQFANMQCGQGYRNRTVPSYVPPERMLSWMLQSWSSEYCKAQLLWQSRGCFAQRFGSPAPSF